MGSFAPALSATFALAFAATAAPALAPTFGFRPRLYSWPRSVCAFRLRSRPRLRFQQRLRAWLRSRSSLHLRSDWRVLLRSFPGARFGLRARLHTRICICAPRPHTCGGFRGSVCPIVCLRIRAVVWVCDRGCCRVCAPIGARASNLRFFLASVVRCSRFVPGRRLTTVFWALLLRLRFELCFFSL